MKGLFLISFLAILPVSLAYAQSDDFGAGAKSCGTWTTLRQTRSVSIEFYEEWILGDVTGIEAMVSGFRKAGVTVNTNADGIFGWIDNYCRANPTVSIAVASIKFVNDNSVISPH